MSKLLRRAFFNCTVALLLCSAIPSEANAESPRYGFVNFKHCVENSKVGKKEQENFESLKKQMEQVLDEKEKALNEISQKFNDADYLDSLSAEAEAELKHKFRNLNQELAQHQQQFYQMLQQANFKVMQKMNDSISTAAKTVAKNKHFDMIINEEGTFYYDPVFDVSKDVIKVMDENFAKENS